LAYELLIPEELKGKSIRNLYTFINRFRAVDWRNFYYGFSIDLVDIEKLPKCGSIPCNYGCIVFVNFFYDVEKFIEYAKGEVDSDILADLKEKVETEEDYVVIHELFEADLVQRIATSHPAVVSGVDLELLVPVVVKVDTLPEDLEKAIALFEQQAARLKAIWDYHLNLPPPIFDAEIHQWNIQYVDPADVEEHILSLCEESDEEDFDIGAFADLIYEDVYEAPKEPGYILVLRLEQDAKSTIKKLEKVIDQALSPIKQHISRRTCVVNLV